MIEIEKGVPIPKDVSPFEHYPWRSLEVGDCFFVKLGCGFAPAHLRHRLLWQRRYYGQKDGMKYEIREERGGFRVWRTK